MKDEHIKYNKSSGNVYKDLGFIDAKERMAKAKLAIKINDIIVHRGLKQSEAAELLKINQPKISALTNGRLSGFSIERLIYFLTLLDQDVDIIIKAKPSRRIAHGKLDVLFGNYVKVASHK